ncbi:hypothetical protein LXA43DRAFT_1103034 [Ganoderma leucocontextum]|nr:hypothetical protein LXA43DRAFT_1103034 [Ganoderma leucocontextum]
MSAAVLELTYLISTYPTESTVAANAFSRASTHAHVDRERSYDIERGANDEYDAQIQYPPLTPPTTSTYEGHMHPSPPTPLSSYSELAQALQYPP